MTEPGPGPRLSAAVEDLWSALAELLIVLAEDQPTDPDDHGLAAADDRLEAASDIQGRLADLRTELGPRELPDLLHCTRILEQLLDLEQRFTQDFVAAGPVGRLRSSTHRRGGGWPVWRRSVEAGADRVQLAAQHATRTAMAQVRDLAPSTLPTTARRNSP